MTIAPPALCRAGFVRLVVVLAALVGITLMQNAHCPAMAMGLSMSTSAGVGDCDVAQVVAGGHGHDQGEGDIAVAAIAPDVSADESGSMLPAGIAMACLAVFLALVSVLALPRRSERSLPLLLSPVRDRSRPRSAPPRPPDLAELCVLRT